MTETHDPSAAMADAFNNYLAQEAERERLRAELLPLNKTAIFDALAAAEILTVVVTFDGYGDSGQIESIDARDAAGEIALPDVQVAIDSPTYATAKIDHDTTSLHDTIESVAYDLLNAAYCGWENNDGAFGDFTFDVATRVITLDYNGRYTAIDSSSHEF